MFSEKLAQYKAQTYLISVFRNYQSEQEILHLFQIIFLALDVLGVCAAFLLGRYFSRLTLRPIIRVITAAERISIEDLTQRIEVSGPKDEIRQLTGTFNDMITRLETAFRRQTQFVSDASHELRTPISVIQGYANLMDRWGKRDPAVLQESIDSIKAETEHMSMLVKKLLFMAKTDHRTMQMQNQPLSLRHVAEEVIREMSVLGVRQSVELIAQGEDGILGDYDLVKQMFWIFLENAIKYSKSIDDKIQITISDESNRRCVYIKDEGIGIGKDDLPYIFERFYRADKSRSSEVPGNGLGLSIAAWILKQHEASVEVTSELDRGTEIIIRFPNI
jgi:signal transduction histidine kinase